MKQVVEQLKSGAVELVETPAPQCGTRQLLVRTEFSLISAGTERMMIEMGKKSLLGKARARPDLVRIAFNKAKKEGFIRVFKEAMSRLDTPMPLGYSAAGTVLAVGSDVHGFAAGDRVACTGAGLASHAELNVLPAEQCVKLPENVAGDEAAFAMLGGIALHGIRSGNLQFGETVAVIGLGLIGLITVQIARAYGCRVIGFDIDPARVALARRVGCRHSLVLGKGDPETSVLNLTGGVGADAVIVAAATSDNAPLLLAERIARRRGRIVLVGVSDLSLTRKMFWDKELTFTVSRASGVSRESHGTGLISADLVRWTDPRNHEEFIRLLAIGGVALKPLITHRFPIQRAVAAYDLILKGREPYIGVLLEYPDMPVPEVSVRTGRGVVAPPPQNVRTSVGIIGAGLFTRNFLAPAVEKTPGVQLVGVAARTGLSAQHLAAKHGIRYATTEYRKLLEDPGIGSVIIATRHDSHDRFVVEALKAGKHIFVEKPLCIDQNGLERIIAARKTSPQTTLMVGFNRRHSPLARRMKGLFAERTGPMQVLVRVNAGYIPSDSWVHDPGSGGGRIIGEVCHFVDFLQYLTGADPVEVHAETIGGNLGKYRTDDNVNVSLRFTDGSLGSIFYTALGSKSFSRERIEVYTDESVGVLDDFRSLEVTGPEERFRRRLLNQELGYAEELRTFFTAGESLSAPMFRSAVWTSAATLAIVRSIQEHRPIHVKFPAGVE